MDLYHDTACPCAYCDLERDERAAARRALRRYAVFTALGFFAGWMAHAWLA